MYERKRREKKFSSSSSRRRRRRRRRAFKMMGVHVMRPGNLVLLVVVCFLLVSDGCAQDLMVADQQHLTMFLENVSPDPSALGFNSSVPACEWPGIVCSQQQRISSITINGKGLKGTIPPGTLGMLSSLKVLDLVNNSLMGEIPSDIGNLTSLIFLLLAYNNLNGSIPSSIGSLGQLKLLDLSFNELVGEIPVSFNKLWSLQLLNLKENHLSGSVPLLQSSWDLQVLDVSSNLLTGGIPPQVLNFCVRLQVLNLSNNGLSGNVPLEITKLVSLYSLDLSRNGFEGSLLPDFSVMPQLRTLFLTSNNLSGSISPSILSLPLLESVSFANNRFAGALPPLPWGAGAGAGTGDPPPQGEGTTTLKFFDCSNNSLDGDLPQGLLAYTNLTIVRLGSNAFTGPIPTNLNPYLIELDLHSNSFSGDIPFTIGALQVLEKLELSSNHLNGTLPQMLSGLRSLTHLGLAGNTFSTSSSSSSSSFMAFNLMENLTYLNLSGTGISGPISSSIGVLLNLLQLDLSHNQLDGAIPTVLANASKLQYLDLSWNNLTGKIPVELGSLNSLSYLNLSYNNLSGSVPEIKQLLNISSLEGNLLLCGNIMNRPCESHAAAFSPAPDQTAGTPPSIHTKSPLHLEAGVIVGIVMGFVLTVFASVVTILLFWTRWQQRQRRTKLPPSRKEPVSKYVLGTMPFDRDPSLWAANVREPGSIPIIIFEKPLLNLSFAHLLQATLGFHKDSQIAADDDDDDDDDGVYGCCPVYKGVLPGGYRIVIKVLFDGTSLEGDEYEKAAQLDSLGKIKHPNIVPLIGYCLVASEQLLIYPYLENGDLHRHLHELPEGTHNPDDWMDDTWENPDEENMVKHTLNWQIRHRIALGTARALAFLHHGCYPHVLHHNVKASKILLDSDYEAHLADCGMATLMNSSGKRFKNTLTTAISGGSSNNNLGYYMPPEYGQLWKSTTRATDVYSFGVVLLELVTGKSPMRHKFSDSYGGGNLVGWVRTLVRDKKGYKCLDSKIVSSLVEGEMLEMLRIAYLCTAELPAKRPTMQQVVGLLKDIQPEHACMQ